jgi:SNF2 family DNA or RNA helicase
MVSHITQFFPLYIIVMCVYIITDLNVILFNLLLQDESHFLKSSKSARTQAGCELLKNVRRIMMLSGTPALSRPIELYPQISAISPKLFPR